MKSKMATAAISNFYQMAFLVMSHHVIQVMVLFCTLLQNVSKIRQSWAKLQLLFFNIQDGGRPPFLEL